MLVAYLGILATLRGRIFFLNLQIQSQERGVCLKCIPQHFFCFQFTLKVSQLYKGDSNNFISRLDKLTINLQSQLQDPQGFAYIFKAKWGFGFELLLQICIYLYLCIYFFRHWRKSLSHNLRHTLKLNKLGNLFP